MKSMVPFLVEWLIAQRLYKVLKQPVFIPVGRYPSCDGTVFDSSPDVRFECKFESTTLRTGNFAIEIAHNGNPSGITSTTANTWYHCFPLGRDKIQVLGFAVADLRELVKPMPTVFGGDFKQSELVLLPLDKARPFVREKFVITVPWEDLTPYWEN